MNTKEQIIEHTSKVILRNHLDHCNCLSDKPSDNADGCVAFQIMKKSISEAPLFMVNTDTELEQMYQSAKEVADAKWQAAVTLLGL